MGNLEYQKAALLFSAQGVYKGKMAKSAYYMALGTKTLFHIKINMEISEFNL
jgi:hypothetical protein